MRSPVKMTISNLGGGSQPNCGSLQFIKNAHRYHNKDQQVENASHLPGQSDSGWRGGGEDKRVLFLRRPSVIVVTGLDRKACCLYPIHTEATGRHMTTVSSLYDTGVGGLETTRKHLENRLQKVD